MRFEITWAHGKFYRAYYELENKSKILFLNSIINKTRDEFQEMYVVERARFEISLYRIIFLLKNKKKIP